MRSLPEKASGSAIDFLHSPGQSFWRQFSATHLGDGYPSSIVSRFETPVWFLVTVLMEEASRSWDTPAPTLGVGRLWVGRTHCAVMSVTKGACGAGKTESADDEGWGPSAPRPSPLGAAPSEV